MENIFVSFCSKIKIKKNNKKNPSEFLPEQRAKSNEQQAKSNEQKVTSEKFNHLV